MFAVKRAHVHILKERKSESEFLPTMYVALGKFYRIRTPKFRVKWPIELLVSHLYYRFSE